MSLLSSVSFLERLILCTENAVICGTHRDTIKTGVQWANVVSVFMEILFLDFRRRLQLKFKADDGLRTSKPRLFCVLETI